MDHQRIRNRTAPSGARRAAPVKPGRPVRTAGSPGPSRPAPAGRKGRPAGPCDRAELSAAGRRRRWFLVGAAACVGAAAGAIPLEDARGEESYGEAVRQTWRHSDSPDLAWPVMQRELVRYATLAASSRNSQPWRFRLFDRGILVMPDPGRRRSATDVDDQAVHVSLGCAVENMVQAAAAFGLQVTSRVDGAGVMLEFDAGSRRRTALFDAIPRRGSARAEFDGRLAAAGHLRLLDAAGRGSGVGALLVTEPRRLEDIAAYVREATAAQMDDDGFIRDMRRWSRLSYRDAIATRDGIFVKSWASAVLPEPVGDLLFRIGFNRRNQCEESERLIRSASGVAVFSAEWNDPAHWIEVGRCSQRFALQATALGMKTSFVNQAVDVPAVRDQFAASLGLGTQRPQVMLRFGHGPDEPRSLRRPVGDVIVQG